MNAIAVIVGGCLAVAAALVLLPVAAVQARAVERSPNQDRVHDLRVLLRRFARISVACGALAAGVCAGLTDWPRIGPVAAVATVAVAVTCLVLPVMAARRPVIAAYARMRGIPARALRSSPKQLAAVLTILAVLAWPAAVAVAAGHGLVAELAVLLVGCLLVNPLVLGLVAPVLAWARGAQALPDEAQQQLARLSDQIGIRARGCVIPGRARKVANAGQLGWLPGLRYVLITDYLLDELAGSEFDAVMAHELGHIRGHDMRARQFFVCLLMVPVGMAAVGLATQSLVFSPVAVAAMVLVWMLMRLYSSRAIRRELAADDVAVAAVGPEAVTAMLERLTELNAIKRETSLSWDRQVRHPGMAQRIARLQTAGTAQASPAPVGTPSTGTTPAP